MCSRATSRGTYAALLRGINVGGKNRLPMDELTRMFVEAGCDFVRTYIQSGNVIFAATPSVARRARDTVAATLLERVGSEVPIILRSVDELKRVVESNPFVSELPDSRTLHVGFLADQPVASRVSSLDSDRSPPDEFSVRGTEIYMRLPNGMAQTRLSTGYLERTLATQVTFRNWRTVLNLLKIATQ